MKFSIITPSFNQGEFIERTINSVLTQEYDGNQIEYIVMDGGSTDQTRAILKKYENKLIWQSESDRGQTHAVNKALALTNGEIIGWLNSDDIYYPETIKIVAKFFADNPDIDVVYGDTYLIDTDDKKLGFYPTIPWDLERLKSYCLLSQPATFFRRRVLVKHGFLEETLTYCMDYAYWLKLGLKGVKFAYIPNMLAGSRMYSDTKSSRFCIEASIETIDWVKKELGYIPSTWFVNYASANAKVAGFKYPQIKFIFTVWSHMWRTTGLYHHGFKRILAYSYAHWTMWREFFSRLITIRKKKIKYGL